ncbi:MAG TPA: OsmC family protein [Chitinophagales bacterium]|nr:OsmC family protein [Chitinophagales bacterium]
MAITAQAKINADHYKVTLTTSTNTFIADEPEEKGGKNEGPNPQEIFLASLGACTCATLRMYADRKEMKLDSVYVELILERDEEKNETNISRQITLTGNLSDEEKKRLMQIADKCPVHKIMSNPIHITTSGA